MTETITLGLLRLCDAAPVIVADQNDMFTREGLQVQLSIEPSWANIADRLSYGLLDGAVMLPPLAIACAAGLRGRKTGLLVPMSLSINGNAITLSVALRDDFSRLGIAGLIAGKRLRLAVVHGFSTHDLLLRDWLASSGASPDDVEIVVLPPQEMVNSLAEGVIDGFCAGAPWGEVAADAEVGFTALRSCDFWPDHPEKCLALRTDFVSRNPVAVRGLLRALRRAAALCADAEYRPALAMLLAQPGYLNLPAHLIARALSPEAGGPAFTRQYPDEGDEKWFVHKMRRWHKALPRSLEGEKLYRPDIFLADT